MFKIKYILYFLLLFQAIPVFPQGGLINSGNLVISTGSSIVITGGYQNNTGGQVTLDGTISLTGDWTNNDAAAMVLVSPGSHSGTTIFAGAGTQTIGGTSTTDFQFEALTVNSGSTTNITAAKAVTAFGATTITSGGFLVLKTDGNSNPKTASFIDNGTISGSLKAEYYLYGNGSPSPFTGRNWYISSPVAAATASAFGIPNSTRQNRISVWDVSANGVTIGFDTLSNGATVLSPTQGFVYRTDATQTISVTGTPNTGSLSTVNIKRAGSRNVRGYYLFGNPYPSSLDWSMVTRTNVDQTIVYRTSNSFTDNTLLYDTWDGITATTNGPVPVGDSIPPLQSVFIRVSGDGLTGFLSMDNSARVHNNKASSQLKSAVQNDIFRIAVKGNGYSDEQVIVQTDIAENGLDIYDAEKLFVSNPKITEIYTLVANKKTVIQAVKPITKETIFPLGINVGTKGSYNFVANFGESLMTNDVYILDRQKKILQNLNTTPNYPFSSEIVNDTVGLRFKLIFSPKGLIPDTSSVAAKSLNLNNAIVYGYKNDVYIKNNISGSDIRIFNMEGKLLLARKLYSDTETVQTGLDNGCYIVKLSNANNSVVKKIILIK